MLKAIEDDLYFDTIGEYICSVYICSVYTKWYTYTEDMKAFSKRFPDVVFCLHGSGENHGDLWDEYYSDGLSQHCEVVIEYPRSIRRN